MDQQLTKLRFIAVIRTFMAALSGRARAFAKPFLSLCLTIAAQVAVCAVAMAGAPEAVTEATVQEDLAVVIFIHPPLLPTACMEAVLDRRVKHQTS
jgi:hypothetical protein